MAAFLESYPWPGPLLCECRGSSWLTPGNDTTHNTHVCAHNAHTPPDTHIPHPTSCPFLESVQIDEDYLLQGWMLGKSSTSGVGLSGCQFLSYDFGSMRSPPLASVSPSIQWDPQSFPAPTFQGCSEPSTRRSLQSTEPYVWCMCSINISCYYNHWDVRNEMKRKTSWYWEQQLVSSLGSAQIEGNVHPPRMQGQTSLPAPCRSLLQ